MVLILEDDPRRVERFRRALGLIGMDQEVAVWPNAHQMASDCPEHLPRTRVISLDHDLLATGGAEDPGDGLIIAEYLVSQPIVRSVIVHTSNAESGTRMVGVFELAEWPVMRVLPIGDDWIETDWIGAVGSLLRTRGR